MGIIYFIIILVANIIGAIGGIGGGILIKPLLSLFSEQSNISISLYSSLAVLTMTTVAIPKQLAAQKAMKTTSLMLVGLSGAIGGLVGNLFLETFYSWFGNQQLLIIQTFLTLLTLMWALWVNVKSPASLKLDSQISFAMTGLVLGILGSFLGIGGGPINVSVLIFFFGISLKKAGLYSLAIIFCSQLTKVTSSFLLRVPEDFIVHLLPSVLLAAILGGSIGSVLKQKLSEEKLGMFFSWIILVVIGLNVFQLYLLVHQS